MARRTSAGRTAQNCPLWWPRGKESGTHRRSRFPLPAGVSVADVLLVGVDRAQALKVVLVVRAAECTRLDVVDGHSRLSADSAAGLEPWVGGPDLGRRRAVVLGCPDPASASGVLGAPWAALQRLRAQPGSAHGTGRPLGVTTPTVPSRP
jgi:hypothetical protein